MVLIVKKSDVAQSNDNIYYYTQDFLKESLKTLIFDCSHCFDLIAKHDQAKGIFCQMCKVSQHHIIE